MLGIYSSDTLTIRGQQGRLTACVSTAMPEAMRRDLLDRLISCFNSDPLRDVDSTSSAPEGQTTFQALHFSWYNRHSTKVRTYLYVLCLFTRELPTSGTCCTDGRSASFADKVGLLKDELQPVHSVHVQRHHRLHCGLPGGQEHPTRCLRLAAGKGAHYLFCCTSIIHWTINQLAGVLPNEYERLEATASVLPDYNISAVHPFVGLVLNFNIATCAHRDSKDDGICLVVPVGDFVGGDLCLVEPGIVLPLRHGDFAVFPSCEITHFNLPYSGRRCSIVLQTDREMSKWTAEDRNGWAANSFFH